MAKYKDSNNVVHDDMDGAALLLSSWPADCVPITDEEAEALRPKQEPTVYDKLAQLDAENAITQRNLREAIMLMSDAIKTVTSGQIDLSQIPSVAKAYQVEAEAATLRAQL